MLGDEDRVPLPRSLPTIVARIPRSQPLRDEVLAVRKDGLQAAILQVGAVLFTEVKLPPKRRAGQFCEYGIEIAHHP